MVNLKIGKEHIEFEIFFKSSDKMQRIESCSWLSLPHCRLLNCIIVKFSSWCCFHEKIFIPPITFALILPGFRAMLLPSDLQIELEYWAETGEFDEDELHEVRS